MKHYKRINLLILIAFCLSMMGLYQPAYSQGGQEVRWLRVGSLHSWYSNFGSETELGRTKQPAQQQDGLRWPALYQYTDNVAAKSMWIGTTNYADRNGTTYPYKVIIVGPRYENHQYEFIPVEFKMIGKIPHPLVYVDGEIATDNNLNDVVDEIDGDLKPDRMIVNVLNTYLGITVTRKLMAFAQQNHDNYFIYDYVFKNTGIVDIHGASAPQTLEGVYFHFQYRYAPGAEAYQGRWAPNEEVNWGKPTVNDCVWKDPTDPAFPIRAQYSWYGPHSAAIVDDWGCPNPANGRLGAVQYMGTVVLYADASATNHTDDFDQPSTTMYIGSDSNPENFQTNMFNDNIMSKRYALMSAGHPALTMAEEVGDGFANLWGTDRGGYSQGQGFGPYTLAPGDSIHIVVAEAVSGLKREKAVEVGKNWYAWYANLNNKPTLVLPDGSTTTNYDEYKRLWVQTGVDSLFKTFRLAIDNYNNDYTIPEAPPPPSAFEVNSGGDRIQLSWTDNATAWPNFDGYVVYRALGKPDTTYEKIFSCNGANVVHTFDDVTAKRGFDYYYYVQTKDDGSTNNGIPLVSSPFYTMTNSPAFLRRPAADLLSEVRVVPNPYNIRAQKLQFGTEETHLDRIGFFGLPPECTIKIFTERGDLIDTIEHTNGTGDELWHSFTEYGQIIVSGVYIAYFRVPKDYVDPATGVIKFREGDSIFRKFVVIR